MIDIFEVIQAAPEAHVRTLLRLLCESDFDIKKTAIDINTKIVELQHPSDGSKKRKRTGETEILYCMYCEDCYVEEDNTATSCAYHPGDPEPDEDFFAEHDEASQGRLDDPWTMNEYPEGYVMTCCGRNKTEKGCKIGRHVSGSKPQKPKNGEHERELADEEEEDEEDEEEYDEEDEEEDEEEEEEEGYEEANEADEDGKN
ncbi:hypothetical protein Dda_7176 [Drechslerella dactyloides]|uniref:Uncharacterized protein n=1 Tax=Drechslerella dactyloides TaxID=74499 RepID=A0AAD6ITT4_DREDA|nr:hypothetical protein Dda_7176 [Drechslerella dactyloides]